MGTPGGGKQGKGSLLMNAKQYIASWFGWWDTYKRSKVGIAGLVITVGLITVILLAPVLATHDPDTMTMDWLQPPSLDHILGTTSVGQDVWSRLLYAGRVSLLIAVIVSTASMIIAVVLGLLSGYFGGLFDELVMRLVDVMLILPRLPLLIALAAVLRGSIWTIILLLIVTGWSSTCRQIRAQTLSCKQHSFVEVSKSVGAGPFHIIKNHIIPNVAGVIIANWAMEIPLIILMESGLSFLGLGDPTTPTWGIMLYFAQQESAFSWGAWYWFVPPGVCIALLGIGFAFIGNTLNDRFVLRLGKRRR